MICEMCKKEIVENANFCSNCGKPITEIARKIETTKKKSIELNLLAKLMDEVNDNKLLEAVNRFVEKITKM